MLISLFSASLWITILSASATACWLWLKRKEEPALIALAGFCLAMATWCFGHIAVLNGYDSLARGLLLANPLLPTTFLHFVLIWLRGSLPLPKFDYRFTALLYTSAIAVTVLSIWGESGHIAAWNVFPRFFHIDSIGWLNLFYTITVGIVAHILLLYGLRTNQGNKRRSIIAMFIVGAWGFSLATSFILPSLGIDFFPYPMLALPSYAVLVVYAVARYRLVEVNRWVSQALQWLAVLVISMLLMSLLLALLAPVGMKELARVPISQLLIYSTILLLLAWLLYGPAKQFSDRLIYPGAVIDEVTLNQWLLKLNSATSWQTLASTLEHIWQQHTPAQASRNEPNIGVKIITATADVLVDHPSSTLFLCIKRGGWSCHLSGWQDIPPAQQHRAELLAALIPNACASLERSLLLAKIESQAERERIEQQHLVELGGLTAAIAHELRNPLNIINMASAQTDDTIKTHIRNQVARAELLIRDTLSYAGKIELKPQQQDLILLVKQVIQQINSLYSVAIELQSPAQMIGDYDADRIQQILVNLLENSAAFINSSASEGKILLIISRDENHTQIEVHNNGPKIPADMLPHLFEPFITQRSGGSGLGLSIVRRIIDAHHGQISHSDALGWPVSFVIQLPIHTVKTEILLS